MNHQITPYSLIFLATGLVSFVVAFLGLQRRKVKSAREIIILTIVAGFWALMAMLESAVTTLPQKILMSQLGYFGAVSTPVFYFLFVLAYVDRVEWLKPGRILWLFIIPFITLVVAWTNQWHGLLWSGFSGISEETNLMEYYHGIWFWIGYFGYNYLLLAIATLLLFKFIFYQTKTYRKQGLVIVIAGLCPWSASILYVTGWNPVTGLDIVPMSIVLSSVLFTYAIFYMKLLDLAPVAREKLVETLQDGIIALDNQNRIQDINAAAISFLGITERNITGKVIEPQVITNIPLFHAVLGDSHENNEVKAADQRIYQIINRKIDNIPGSRLVIIRDISEQRNYENNIVRRDRLLDAIARATTLMIKEEFSDETITQTLEILGCATEVNRVHIFRNQSDMKNDRFSMSHEYEWTDGTVLPVSKNPDSNNVIYYRIFSEWANLLSTGQPIVGLIKDFPEGERKILEQYGIRSIFVTPVLSEKIFWGCIGFDDCETEREWQISEEQILSTAATAIGAAYQRKKSQDELIASKIKAEENEKLKSAFLTNMSHEIRTPMNGILGFISLLQDQNLSNAEKEEFLTIVKASGERLLSTLNDIIDISKIESGMMPLNYSRVHVNDLITNLYDFYKREATGKGLQLFHSVDLQYGAVDIWTDKEKLSSILSNMIRNALKFTEKGFAEFGYQVKDDFLEFFVKDTGTGIPYDKQEAVFERFIQADYSISRQYEGSGLGLSIARAYVTMLGGKIWVNSEPGRGSEFYFTIPWLKKQSSPSTQEAQASVMEMVTEKKLKILVTEDEQINLEFLQVILTKAGYTVIPASSGVEAIAHLRNDPEINLIIMDIRLPGMDGYETTREIKKLNKDIPVIALTAHAFAGDREKSVEAGCSFFLTKPVRKSDLLKAIESLV